MSDGTTTGMLNLVFNKYQSAVIVLTGHVLRRLDLSNHSCTTDHYYLPL